MKAISVQIRTACGKCGSPLPLNAMVPRLACPACSAENELSDAFWTAVLGDSSLSTCTIITEGRTVAMEVGRGADPECATCGATIPAREAMAGAEQGFVACGNCAARVRVRVPPKAWVLSGFRLLVGEDEMQIPAEGETLPVSRGAMGPVAFNCPNCAGVLQVDGSARVVKCGYCAGSAYLPDDLWHVFHPVAVARPWYLLYGRGLAKHARKDAEDPATSPERLAELAQHMDYAVREAVVRHRNTAPETLRMLVEADETLGTDALDNPSLTPELWALLAGTGQSWILRKIAGHRHAPADVLRAVADHVVHRLSDDWDGDEDDFDSSDVDQVLEGLAGNAATPSEVLARVAALNAERRPSERADIGEALAKHANAPAALLADSARSEDDSVRQAVAAHRGTTVEVLEPLAADADWNVRAAVAKRTEVSPETLKRLGKDADSDVREAARANPSYPRFSLWKALFGG
ncbi:HEAT repeat domain-containing protein [Longimicrobium sp.]|uniref:HEAT repeat domain-containing protein n=1 Tax=Longimicrobium sp. TaxID=2029185 RepID=UPI002E33C441|nr:HEAT repeat domain-containing protein [Longimicrobium sp.]HEX6040635.1 HEAT repeat domain-containing protein [Longimicrobium sp.]